MEPVKKREIFGWAMYDFANSSYVTVVITAIYASFFTEFIVPAGSTARDSLWATATFFANFIAFVLSPFIGAICDLSGKKKIYLFFTTVICALATVALSTVGPGDLGTAVFFVSLSYAAFLVSETLCGSFLTELSTPQNMGKVSGIGWAIGYFGGLACLAAVQLIVTAEPESNLALFVKQNQNALVMTGVFYFVTSLPTFIFVKNRSRPAPGFESASVPKLFSAGLDQFKHTWQLLKENPVLLRFFKSFAVYMAGLNVVVAFVGIYARGELGFSTGDLVSMFLILQISAAVGAFAFGYVEDRIGPKNTVLITIFWWICAILAIFFLRELSVFFSRTEKEVFFVIALIAGAALGATQSSSRAIVGILAPPEHSAQIFGCWGAFIRISSVLSAAFGFLSDALASRRLALLLVVVFFAVGGIMFARVPLPHGKEKHA